MIITITTTSEAVLVFSETSHSAVLTDYTAKDYLPTLTNTTGETATYTSSNTKVAVCLTDGTRLTGTGTTTITANADGRTASYTLTVTADAATYTTKSNSYEVTGVGLLDSKTVSLTGLTMTYGGGSQTTIVTNHSSLGVGAICIDSNGYSFVNNNANPTMGSYLTFTTTEAGTLYIKGNFATNGNTILYKNGDVFKKFNDGGTSEIYTTQSVALAANTTYVLATQQYGTFYLNSITYVTSTSANKTWDFTTGFSDALSSDWNATSTALNIYNRSTDEYTSVLTSSGTELSLTAGLLFKGQVRLYKDANNYAQLFSTASVEIPVKAGQKLTLTYSGNYSRTATITNVTNLDGSEASLNYSQTTATSDYLVTSDGYVTITNSATNKNPYLYIETIALTNSTPALTFSDGATPAIGTSNVPYTNAVNNAPINSNVTYAVTTKDDAITAYTFDTSTGTFSSITGTGSITVTATSSAIGYYDAGTGSYTVNVTSMYFANTTPTLTISSNGTSTYTQAVTVADGVIPTYTCEVVSGNITADITQESGSADYTLSVSGTGVVKVTATSGLLTASYTLTVSGLTFANVDPSIKSGTTTYSQEVEDNTVTNVTWSIVEKSSGITSAAVNVKTGELTNISGNGIIRVRATSGDVYADYVLTVAYATHTWDFYSNTSLTFGNLAGSTTLTDATSTSETTTYWTPTNIGSTEHVSYAYGYLNPVYGDNGFIITETIGLQFKCAAKYFGVNNSSTDGKRRFVAMHSGSTLTIPKLTKGQYVKMYWSPYAGGGSGATFTSTNVTDLDDVSMNGVTFPTNGCWRKSTTDGTPYGPTIFKVEANGDVTFTLPSTATNLGWNSLIKIEVANSYSTDLVLSNLSSKQIEIRRNNYSIIHESSDSAKATYYGTSGATYCENAKSPICTIEKEGNVNITYCDSAWISAGGVTYKDLKITVKSGTGNLKVTQRVYTGSYVTDKKETWLAVGEYTKQTYPYTWDFTDYNMSKGSYTSNLSGTTAKTTTYGNWTNSNGTYGLTTHCTEETDVLKDVIDGTKLSLYKPLFAPGSQLTYGTKALPETKGIGVTMAWDAGSAGSLPSSNDNVKIDGTAIALTTGTRVTSATYTIPSVDAGMYVFVKASGAPTVTIGGTAADSITNSAYTLDDGVYLYQNTGTTAADVAITTTGISIYKIGVTNINKNINKDGKTTESRDCAIDYSQSAEFTNNSLQPYYINAESDYTATTDKITLKEVSVVPANTGLVLYNNPTTTPAAAVDVPLFVPAVNIDTETVSSNSPLKPNVTSQTVSASDATTYRYVFTNKFKYTGTGATDYTTGDYGFYKVNTAGTLAANKAYLELLATSLTASAKSIVLLSFDDDSTTGISDTTNGVTEHANADDAYYNLNGVKLNGKPTQKGIYINNGKKVYIK